MKKKWIAVLLAVALALVLFGCQKEPSIEQTEQTETQPPETTVPAPDPGEVYSEACAALEAMADVTLDVTQVLTTTVEGHSFVDESEQVLTYSGLDTDAPVIRLEQEVEFELADILRTAGEEEEEDTTRVYSEVYGAGTLYVELAEQGALSGALTPEESAARYIPAALLDAALYEDLSMEEDGDQTVITFQTPTAPEVWAMPEGAELLEASGAAVIEADGGLMQMNYDITYQYGPAEISLQIESVPREAAETAAVPEDTERYTPVQYVDALQMAIYSANMQKNAQEISLARNQTIISQAGGVAYGEFTEADLIETEDDLMTKLVSTTHVADSVNGSQSTTLEETYRDGTYMIVVDDSVPTKSTVDKEDVREAFDLLLTEGVASPILWQDVTVEDLGSVYLLEYTYNEDFGNGVQNAICTLFWSDPTALNSLATDYVNKEMSGYMAIDKYTGMMTASGFYYEGVHTIEGDEYSLSLENNRAVEMPAFGAYKAITDELQREEEPAEKATPLFYHVTGEEGQEMWLLGTIHVGDARTGFLPKEVYEAFEASDALALEMDQEAFDKEMEEDSYLVDKVSRALYYSDGSTVEEHMGEELYAQALKYMKASGSYSSDAQYMKPYLWQSAIEDFYLQQGHQLHSEQGVEERLTQLAKEQEKPIREVESGLLQIQMLTGWSEELQQVLLADVLNYSAEEYWTEVYELYEMWCAGDEEALRKELSSEEDLSELTEEELAEYNALLPLYEEYDQGMSHDRNADMLEVAVEYLESGEVIFYAVGLAHLLDDTSGLVDALQEAGYTVELVTYYQ